MPADSHKGLEDRRAALIPPELLPLFDDAFVRSCELIEEYAARLALEIFRACGLEAVCAQESSVEEAIDRLGMVPGVARVPVAWLCETLAGRAWLTRNASEGRASRYRLDQPLPRLEPAEILAAQSAHDARCLPSYRIAALAAEHYPAVLRGEESGEQALFGPEGVSTWVRYFSNANPLYAISNAVGAIAAEHAMPAGPASILEVGGGLGSGAEALLDRLAFVGRSGDVSTYRFTEISPLFLKRAQRTLAARYPQCRFAFGALDLDRPLAAAGIEPESCSLIYGVNVLHAARDLAATLFELRRALRPGGALVVAECVRPFPGVPVHLELTFNLLGAFRDVVLVHAWRPNGGFLAPEQWSAAFQTNGFRAVRVYPDIAAIRDTFPGFLVAAIVGTRA
jgi:SAM-dependent methyltransferase